MRIHLNGFDYQVQYNTVDGRRRHSDRHSISGPMLHRSLNIMSSPVTGRYNFIHLDKIGNVAIDIAIIWDLVHHNCLDLKIEPRRLPDDKSLSSVCVRVTGAYRGDKFYRCDTRHMYRWRDTDSYRDYLTIFAHRGKRRPSQEEC